MLIKKYENLMFDFRSLNVESELMAELFEGKRKRRKPGTKWLFQGANHLFICIKESRVILEGLQFVYKLTNLTAKFLKLDLSRMLSRTKREVKM